MNKFIIQDLIIYSLILGFIFGVLSVIPYVGTFMIFGIMLLVAPLVMIYLIMAGKMDLTTLQNSIIDGAITGFSANLTFTFSACIVLVLLQIGFKYSPNYLLTSMIMNSSVWIIIMCSIFIGTLVAATNAFSGFLTYYTINFIRDAYERKHPHKEESQDFTQYLK